MNYYIFIDEHTILTYKGEILKRYVGNRLVKVISNPTERDLVEFGYKPLVEEEIPTYDKETYYLEMSYIDEEDRIVKHYEVKEIPENIEE